MMRALYTAASGMIAQQTNVDVISNNLANVNSTGYKTSTAEFKSLLYQTLQSRSTSANGDYKPIPAQVGTGTRNASVTTQFTQGALIDSANTYSFAIQGNGMFGVIGADGEMMYTRNGNFGMAILGEDEYMLSTSEGYSVVDTDGNPIVFDKNLYEPTKLVVTGDGTFCYPDEDGNLQDLEIKIGVYQFTNPSGLESVGGSMYKESDASGYAMEENIFTELKKSTIVQGRLEASNVQVADEMVNLIVAQRAYEMNSKAIQTADSMLQTANELKR